MDKKYYTVIEAAKELNVCRNTIYGWISKGILKAYRPSGTRRFLVPRESIDSLIYKASNNE